LSLPGGIVFTGGVAATPNIEKLAKRVFDVKVRSYVPSQMGMRYPSYSLGLGLVTYASRLNDIGVIADNVVNGAAISTKKAASQTVVKEQNRPQTETTATSVQSETEQKKMAENSKPEKEKKVSKLKEFWSKFFD